MKLKINICLNTQEEGYAIVEKIHQGSPYLVVPVTMMVEGVHSGNHGPLLHKIEDLGMFPNSWNGIPVVVNHPTDADGIAISANSPDIIDNEMVGRIYNTKVDGTKLRAEAWVNEAKLDEVFADFLVNIKEGKPIEVSTGMFVEEEKQEGVWHNEENYIAIARNIRPDHLALLTDAEGACSIDDGCGIRNNKEGENKMEIKKAVQALQSEGYSIQRIGNYAEQGYRELMDLVYDKLSSMGSQNVWYYLEELYEDSLVYSKSGDADPVMYKQGYKITDGKIEFVGEPVEVKKEIKYVVMEKSSKMKRTKFGSISNNKKQKQEVNMSKKVETPCCEDLVDELIANERTKWDVGNKEWMLTLEEDVLQKMIPEKEKEPEPVVNSESKKETVVKIEKEDKPGDGIELLSAEDKAALAYGRKQLKERRNTMIKGIQDNAGKEIWPDEVLATYDEDTLERVFNSVRKDEIVDYSLNGNTELTSNEQEVLYPAGVMDEEIKQGKE